MVTDKQTIENLAVSQHTEDDAAQTDTPAEHGQKTSTKRSGCRPGRIIFHVLVLLLLCVIVGAMWYQQRQSTRSLRAKFLVLQNQSQQMQEAFSQLQQSSDANARGVTTLLQLRTHEKWRWQLHEAAYLAQLSQFVLRVRKQPIMAAELMQGVNDRLASVQGSVSQIAVRKQLSQTIDALQAVPRVDNVGLYMQLQALSQEVTKLPLFIGVTHHKRQAVLASQPIENYAWWKKSLVASWHTIRQFIVIRHHVQPVEPILSSGQHDQLNLNLQTVFAQAEWAMLNRNNQIYQAALQTIQHTIQRYFVQSDAATQQIMKSLKTLRTVNIAPKLPDIRPTITTVQRYIAEQMASSRQQVGSPAKKTGSSAKKTAVSASPTQSAGAQEHNNAPVQSEAQSGGNNT